jgi:hypothetical protein
MDRDRVNELHYIAHFDNVASILDRGVLSHRLAAKVGHRSVASEEVQAIRAAKVVPNGLPLHRYANFYFDARNSMMSKIRHENPEIAVLRIDPAALDIEGVVVADRNAAGPARFFDSAEGVASLDESAVYARWWTQSLAAKQRRCAEVLVPHRLGPEFIRGAYVMDQDCAERLERLIAPRDFEIVVNPDLFFTGGTAR